MSKTNEYRVRWCVEFAWVMVTAQDVVAEIFSGCSSSIPNSILNVLSRNSLLRAFVGSLSERLYWLSEKVYWLAEKERKEIEYC